MTTDKSDTLRRLRRAALDGKVERALADMGLQLTHPRALDDVQRAVADELTINDAGEVVRASDGRFATLYEVLDRMRNEARHLFAPGATPTKNPYTVRPDRTKPDNRPVIPASQMGNRLEDVAAGKVRVEHRSDGTG